MSLFLEHEDLERKPMFSSESNTTYSQTRSIQLFLLWINCALCLVFLMLLRLFIAALWSPAGKGLTSWVLLVMFIVFLLLSHVVSWVRCGTLLYCFLIFASFLTFLTLCSIGNLKWNQFFFMHTLLGPVVQSVVSHCKCRGWTSIPA